MKLNIWSNLAVLIDGYIFTPLDIAKTSSTCFPLWGGRWSCRRCHWCTSRLDDRSKRASRARISVTVII